LKGELSTASRSAAALAFIAVIVKDYGAVERASQLYLEAVELKPDSSAYVLNYVHVLEIEFRYQEAVDVIKRFCKNNLPNFEKDSSYGPLILEGLKQITKLLEVVGDVFEPLHSRQMNTDIASQKKLTTALVLPKHPSVSPSSSSSLPDPSPSSTSTSLITYNADELDLLALFFTIAKILYVVGHLTPLPRLTEILGMLSFPLLSKPSLSSETHPHLPFSLEPLREGRDLHLTSIRNEHAYYCCIAQLLPHISIPLPPHDILYVAGDSHCLSTAWQTLEFKNKSWLLRPMLVTGLKTWHLRPESRFFPKNNFYTVIDQS
jgi:tetratricopeptide (TPR) repeat protein